LWARRCCFRAEAFAAELRVVAAEVRELVDVLTLTLADGFEVDAETFAEAAGVETCADAETPGTEAGTDGVETAGVAGTGAVMPPSPPSARAVAGRAAAASRPQMTTRVSRPEGETFMSQNLLGFYGFGNGSFTKRRTP
jgi:hypothetical protein